MALDPIRTWTCLGCSITPVDRLASSWPSANPTPFVPWRTGGDRPRVRRRVRRDKRRRTLFRSRPLPPQVDENGGAVPSTSTWISPSAFGSALPGRFALPLVLGGDAGIKMPPASSSGSRESRIFLVGGHSQGDPSSTFGCGFAGDRQLASAAIELRRKCDPTGNGQQTDGEIERWQSRVFRKSQHHANNSVMNWPYARIGNCRPSGVTHVGGGRSQQLKHRAGDVSRCNVIRGATGASLCRFAPLHPRLANSSDAAGPQWLLLIFGVRPNSAASESERILQQPAARSSCRQRAWQALDRSS